LHPLPDKARTKWYSSLQKCICFQIWLLIIGLSNHPYFQNVFRRFVHALREE